MRIQKSITFLLLLVTVLACKETKKEDNETKVEEKVDVVAEFFSSYQGVKVNKKLADKIKIDNLFIKSKENGLDDTKNYVIVFDFNEEYAVDDITNYKLTIQLVPNENEKELLNDIAKERKASSEYYFLDINSILERETTDEVSAFFNVNKKEYVSISFNTRLNNLQYLAILLRDVESNKYLKQNIKLKEFVLK